MRQANRANTVAVCALQQDREHRRMEVEVQVSVYVIEREAGRAKSLELRIDLRFELLAQPALKKEFDPGCNWPVGKLLACAHESRHLFCRQAAAATHQCQV